MITLLQCIFVTICIAQIPQEINYQAKVEVDGVPYDGAGEFKFAIVDSAGTQTFWSNDGTSAAGSEPSDSVSLNVSGGILNVRLGDESHPNMTAISPSVFENQDAWLRIWFDDGSHGFQKLGQDQKLTSVPYAMMAQNVPDLSLNGWKLKHSSVWPEHQGRTNSIVSLNGLIHDTYVSFDFDSSTPEIDPVPTGKTLILTDIVFGAGTRTGDQPGLAIGYTIGTNPRVVVFRQLQKGRAYPAEYHPTSINLNSGIPIPGGAVIECKNYNAASASHTVV